jgi:hypothetical protein
MELLVIIVAVGISALYLTHRFLRSLGGAAQPECRDGCCGCACTHGHRVSGPCDEIACTAADTEKGPARRP